MKAEALPMATRKAQAMVELAVGMFALALVVSALAGFAVYIAKSLRAQNMARSSSPSSDTRVDVGAFAGEWVFGRQKLEVQEKVPPELR
jgi:hypothetical protein